MTHFPLPDDMKPDLQHLNDACESLNTQPKHLLAKIKKLQDEIDEKQRFIEFSKMLDSFTTEQFEAWLIENSSSFTKTKIHEDGRIETIKLK